MTLPTKLSRRRLARLSELVASRGPKAKASLSLSADLIRAADELAGDSGRSSLVERAVRRHLRAVLRRLRHQQDLDAINASAKTSNRESDELLKLQAWPE